MPELLTTIITSDGNSSSEVSIIAKTDGSLPWAAYSGPLRFKVQ